MITQACTNSTSNVIVTSSPTSKPPASSAAFQFSPKSFAVNPGACRNADARTAPRVFMRRRRPFDVEHDFARNAMNRQVARYCELVFVLALHACRCKDQTRVSLSTSKQLGLFRCPSRWASRVLIDAASAEASIRDYVISFGSSVIEPVLTVNCRFTFEIIMCRHP